MTLPNKITVVRILMSPVLFALILFSDGVLSRVFAFFVFFTAAVSDLYDGYLARKHGVVTEFGKVVDPLADKCLLAAAFIAFYLLRNESPAFHDVRLWIVLVIMGREAIILLLRYAVKEQGNYFQASGLAKMKTLTQNFFIGSVLVRYVHLGIARDYPDLHFQGFDIFHKDLNYYTLWLVIALTTLSGLLYLVRFRHLVW